MSYIGGIQVESGESYKIGSTLFGTCSVTASTAAKTVTLSSFDTPLVGVTVHVKFTAGNSVADTILHPVTLQVGSDSAYIVTGNFLCQANDVISFTLDQVENTKYWRVNGSVDISEGTTDGTIKVNGTDVGVHGLGSAAYTASTAYATAAQGAAADAAMPASGGTFTGPVSGPAVNDSSPSGSLATIDYVQSKTAGLSGLSGAMHYKGTSTNAITDGGTENPVINGTTITTKEPGDVVLYNNKEYVWVETDATNHTGYWEELGDEGSFVLKTSQTSGSVGSASLGAAIDADDITNWDDGSASSATVSGGILILTNSVVPTLSYTAKTIPNVSVTSTNVIVPVSTTP